jgi:hypothetical protein
VIEHREAFQESDMKYHNHNLYGSSSRKGMISIIAVLTVFTFSIIIAMMYNVGNVIRHKLELQNAADAMAKAGGVSVARIMNTVTAANHLTGEVMAIVIYHEAFGSPSDKSEDSSDLDTILEITKTINEGVKTAADAVSAPYPAIPEELIAYEKVHAKIESNYAIRDAKLTLKILYPQMVILPKILSHILQACFPIPIFGPPIYGIGELGYLAAHAIDLKFYQESVTLDALEVAAKAMQPLAKTMYTLAPRIRNLSKVVSEVYADGIKRELPKNLGAQFRVNGFISRFTEKAPLGIPVSGIGGLGGVNPFQDLLDVDPSPNDVNVDKIKTSYSPDIPGSILGSIVGKINDALSDGVSKAQQAFEDTEEKIKDTRNEIINKQQQISDLQAQKATANEDQRKAIDQEIANVNDQIAQLQMKLAKLQEDLKKAEQAKKDVGELGGKVKDGINQIGLMRPRPKRNLSEFDCDFKLSQLVRATYPFVDFHRQTFTDSTLVSAIFFFSEFPKHYRYWTSALTLSRCSEYVTEGGPDNRMMLVLKKFDPKNKGKESWTTNWNEADRMFSTFATASRPDHPHQTGGNYFKPSNVDGMLCYAQACIYNANANRTTGVDGRVRNFGTSHQPEWAWDTLNWEPPGDASIVEWPTVNESVCPPISLGWKARLIPATTQQLLRADAISLVSGPKEAGPLLRRLIPSFGNVLNLFSTH